MQTAMSLNYVHTQARVALDTDQSTGNREFAVDELINALHSLPDEAALRAILAVTSNNEAA
jgi:hypothetical protein